MRPIQPLPIQQLRRLCDSAQFDFETSAELEDLGEIIGQERNDRRRGRAILVSSAC